MVEAEKKFLSFFFHYLYNENMTICNSYKIAQKQISQDENTQIRSQAGLLLLLTQKTDQVIYLKELIDKGSIDSTLSKKYESQLAKVKKGRKKRIDDFLKSNDNFLCAQCCKDIYKREGQQGIKNFDELTKPKFTFKDTPSNDLVGREDAC